MHQLQNGVRGYEATVSMVALAMGTIAGEAGIIHVDPNSNQKAQREPLVSEVDSERLLKRKLAVRRDRDLPDWAVPLLDNVDLKRLEGADEQEDEETQVRGAAEPSQDPAPVAARDPAPRAAKTAAAKPAKPAKPATARKAPAKAAEKPAPAESAEQKAPESTDDASTETGAEAGDIDAAPGPAGN